MKKSICIEKLFVDLPFYDRFPWSEKPVRLCGIRFLGTA